MWFTPCCCIVCRAGVNVLDPAGNNTSWCIIETYDDPSEIGCSLQAPQPCIGQNGEWYNQYFQDCHGCPCAPTGYISYGTNPNFLNECNTAFGGCELAITFSFDPVVIRKGDGTLACGWASQLWTLPDAPQSEFGIVIWIENGRLWLAGNGVGISGQNLTPIDLGPITCPITQFTRYFAQINNDVTGCCRAMYITIDFDVCT